jgi:AraC family transcriptional regulator
MLAKNKKMSKINIMSYIIRDGKPFGFCVYPPGATLGPRLLADYEIVWIESGGAKWYHNDNEYKLIANSVLLLKPGDRETFLWHRDKPTAHYFFHFDINHKHKCEYKLFEDENNWPLTRNLPQNNVLKPMLMNALRLIRSGCKDSDPSLQSMLRQVLLTFITGSFEVEQAVADDLPPAVERVFSYIDRCWQEFPLIKPDLDTLAAKALVSPTHLCRIFNATFNMSPIQTITTMRVKRASTLLVRTNYPLKQIADLTGFENQYHFSRLFKKIHGICPSQYRKNSLQAKPMPISSIIVKRF